MGAIKVGGSKFFTLHAVLMQPYVVLAVIKPVSCSSQLSMKFIIPINIFCHFVRFDSLRPSHHFFSYVGTGLPGLNQYYARLKETTQ